MHFNRLMLMPAALLAPIMFRDAWTLSQISGPMNKCVGQTYSHVGDIRRESFASLAVSIALVAIIGGAFAFGKGNAAERLIPVAVLFAVASAVSGLTHAGELTCVTSAPGDKFSAKTTEHVRVTCNALSVLVVAVAVGLFIKKDR